MFIYCFTINDGTEPFFIHHFILKNKVQVKASLAKCAQLYAE